MGNKQLIKSNHASVGRDSHRHGNLDPRDFEILLSSDAVLYDKNGKRLDWTDENYEYPDDIVITN